MSGGGVDPGRGVRDVTTDAVQAACLAALGLFLLLSISGRAQDLLPSPARMAIVLAWPAALLLYLVSRRMEVVIAYCIGGGFVLRWVDFFPGGGSDVLPVTNEAIATLLSGGNPYAHFFLSERPRAFTFPYPPVEMAVHLPGYLIGGLPGVRFTEVAAAVLVMALFAWLARSRQVSVALPAMALYAALPNLIDLSVDAGNDTSTGAVLFVAVLVAAWALRRPGDQRAMIVAGLAAAAALGTKQTTMFVIALLAALVWHRAGKSAAARYVGTAAAALLVVALPFILMDPASFVTSMAGLFTHHDVYGWNIWVFAQWMGWPVAGVHDAAILASVVTLAAMVVALLFRYERVSSAVAAGTLVTLVAFLASRWTTYSYFAVVAPLILALPVLVRLDPTREFLPVASGAGAEGPATPG